MRYLLLIIFISTQSFGFTVFNKHRFKSRWVSQGGNISGIKKVNPVYFEDKTARDQLDIDHWIKRVEEMSVTQKRRDDNVNKSTLVGKIIFSVGDVRIIRGQGRVAKEARFLYEGDILETKATGACWLVLLDGALLRISPRSSISLSEVMFNEKNFNAFIRLNRGEVYFLSRSKNDLGKTGGDFFDFSFMGMMNTALIEDVVGYFGETLFSSKKISLKSLLEMQKVYSNDNQFEAWSLKSNYFFFNENFFSSIPPSEVFFLIEGKRSFFKINKILEENERPGFSLVGYLEEEMKAVENGKWYVADRSQINEAPELEGVDFFLKTLTNNLTPFFFERELFMKSYSYFFSNIGKYPLIKSLPQYWGNSLDKRKKFAVSYYRRAEKSFQIVKDSFSKDIDNKIISKGEYDSKYHRADIRLLTLIKLKIINLEEIINEGSLLYSSIKRVNEVVSENVQNIFKKLKESEKNNEYISRQ